MDTTAKKRESRNFENSLNWFEIPVLDINRAVGFYNTIYGIDMEMTESNNYVMAFFPESNGIGGALVKGPGCVPSQTGSLIYLNGGEDLQLTLDKVRDNGGQVILEKTEVANGHGSFGLFIDSEGNKLALHSKRPTAPKPQKPPRPAEKKKAMRETPEEEVPEIRKKGQSENRKIPVGS